MKLKESTIYHHKDLRTGQAIFNALADNWRKEYPNEWDLNQFVANRLYNIENAELKKLLLEDAERYTKN